MPYDGDDRDWGDDNGDDWEEPPRETITHRHPSLPFIEITQTRYAGGRTTEDDRFETWGFEILGPREAEGYPLAYDGVAHTRGDHTEAEMIADMAYRAEKHMLDDRGPFFVLRIYLETGPRSFAPLRPWAASSPRPDVMPVPSATAKHGTGRSKRHPPSAPGLCRGDSGRLLGWRKYGAMRKVRTAPYFLASISRRGPTAQRKPK